MQSYLEESIIEYPPYRFLITKVPSDSNMDEYRKLLIANNVKTVIRACEPSYNTEVLHKDGITVHEFNFPDGSGPPKNVLTLWLKILHSTFVENAGKEGETKTIALHCVAGLGRAPVLVGIALIQAGMSPLDAIEFIRKRRKGALNTTQLKYLLKYKKKTGSDCVIA